MAGGYSLLITFPLPHSDFRIQKPLLYALFGIPASQVPSFFLFRLPATYPLIFPTSHLLSFPPSAFRLPNSYTL